MSETNSTLLDGKARAIELLHQMHDAARPEGIFERFAVQRLAGAWWHFERFIALSIQRANTDEAAPHQKTALRWEACYNRAMRELRTLQTARAIANPADPPPPMANLQQLQHFAKRTPPPPLRDSDARSDRQEGVAGAPATPAQPTKSTICETNSHPGKVGRNSPCPCGSGLKFKRYCGANAAPIYNCAA
ncbi:MAG: SEC-C domain-containing protein [Bryobacterales bacterium]|nr:SEC-C domain-containing protein [Bryobacterales bacterium]